MGVSKYYIHLLSYGKCNAFALFFYHFQLKEEIQKGKEKFGMPLNGKGLPKTVQNTITLLALNPFFHRIRYHDI